MKLSPLKRLRGVLIAAPIVNVPGFLNLNRYLPGRRDLNRSFPGSAKGSLAARLAKLFRDEIVTGCTYGIDLHTGAVHRENYPQIRASLDDAQAERMAQASFSRVTNGSVCAARSARRTVRSVPVAASSTAHRSVSTTTA